MDELCFLLFDLMTSLGLDAAEPAEFLATVGVLPPEFMDLFAGAPARAGSVVTGTGDATLPAVSASGVGVTEPAPALVRAGGGGGRGSRVYLPEIAQRPVAETVAPVFGRGAARVAVVAAIGGAHAVRPGLAGITPVVPAELLVPAARAGVGVAGLAPLRSRGVGVVTRIELDDEELLALIA